MTDRRRMAQSRDQFWDFDEEAMTIEITLENDEGEEEDLTFPARFEVCSTCEGKGRHVNPAIDENGLSYEDFDADPDFAEDYRAGVYDVACYECHGKRVVPEVDEQACDEEQRKRLEDYNDLVRSSEDERRERMQERAMGY